MNKNKLAQGILSLLIIIVLLVSILAGSFYFQNNITTNSIKETALDENQITGEVTGVERVSGI